jgi:hypothetical protein
MRGFLTYGLVAVVVALSGCADNATVVAPRDDRLRWNWDHGLATGAGQPVLICSPLTPAFNETVSCSFTDGGPLNFPTWRFEGVGGVPVQGPSLTGGWSGPMVISGDVVVSYVDNYGNPGEVRETVNVNRRSWTWASSVGGRQGTPGEIDSCMASRFFGLTASAYCTDSTTDDLFDPRPAQVSSGSGYTAASVLGSGINGGLWYVSTTSAHMDLRTQVHQTLRSDGVAWSVASNDTVANGCAAAFPSNPTDARNIYTVNNTCVPTPAFNDNVICLWSHEGQHLSAATTSAQSATNDVYALWEPLAAQSLAGLQFIVAGRYSEANARVLDDAAATENTGTEHQYKFWYNSGGGWGTVYSTTRC